MNVKGLLDGNNATGKGTERSAQRSIKPMGDTPNKLTPYQQHQTQKALQQRPFCYLGIDQRDRDLELRISISEGRHERAMVTAAEEYAIAQRIGGVK